MFDSFNARIRLRLIRAVAACACIYATNSSAFANPLIDSEATRPVAHRLLSPPTEKVAETPAAATPDRSPTGSLLTTCGALGLVLMVFLGLVRSWKQKQSVQTGGLSDAVFEILGTRRLTVKQSIQLIRVGQRILVVGLTETGMTTLAEITDPHEVEHLADACRRPESAANAQTFRAVYDQFVQQSGGQKSKATLTPMRLSELEESHRA